MWVCLCASKTLPVELTGTHKLLNLLSTEKREKKRSESEINKIINERVIVTMYIYTITVARVEIYIFLHNFRSTDVEHF